jgi:hypothetical protein
VGDDAAVAHDHVAFRVFDHEQLAGLSGVELIPGWLFAFRRSRTTPSPKAESCPGQSSAARQGRAAKRCGLTAAGRRSYRTVPTHRLALVPHAKARSRRAALDAGGGPLGRRPAGRGGSERDVVGVGAVGRLGPRQAGLVAAGLGPVFDVDAVQLERDAVLAGVGDVFARFEASGEADGLALDEVLGGGRGLRLPDDQVDVDGLGVAVAAVGWRPRWWRRSCRSAWYGR